MLINSFTTYPCQSSYIYIYIYVQKKEIQKDENHGATKGSTIGSKLSAGKDALLANLEGVCSTHAATSTPMRARYGTMGPPKHEPARPATELIVPSSTTGGLITLY
ncbi:hypothetical protein FH972_005870 [Carpinus fangiana]|uniref:Uncharacterized protein n=1 Tax=Carpinus fangiana TaxID=176857 RepID=A0A5N6QTH9_9ROSI|nr:hypothetical protein FH972_005870 [Carpinus fangiana]